MAVAYEQFQNDPIEAQSLQSSDSEERSTCSDQILVIDGTESADPRIDENDGDYQDLRMRRMHNFLQNKWPYKSSTLQLCFGIILVGLGIIQIIILPLLDDSSTEKLVALRIDRTNCYGIGEWIGILLVLSGCMGMRAAAYKSIFSVYIYFGAILVEMLALVLTCLLLVIGYSKHWTTLSGLEGNKVLFYVQLSVSLTIILALLVVIYSFLQYYEDICFGELQCCKRVVHFFLPCLCPRAVQGHELLQENDERPPSLPV